MKPVMQTKLGSPGGNCFPACVASLIELDIDDVPDFCNNDDEDYDWAPDLSEWLRPRGLDCAVTTVLDGGFPKYWRLYWIAGGQTETGAWHCVVYRGQEPVHDPHPGKCGLDKLTDAVLLVPVDLAEWVPRNEPMVAMRDKPRGER